MFPFPSLLPLLSSSCSTACLSAMEYNRGPLAENRTKTLFDRRSDLRLSLVHPCRGLQPRQCQRVRLVQEGDRRKPSPRKQPRREKTKNSLRRRGQPPSFPWRWIAVALPLHRRRRGSLKATSPTTTTLHRGTLGFATRTSLAAPYRVRGGGGKWEGG